MIFEFTCTDLVRNKFFFQYDKTKLVIKKGLSKWYNLGPSLSQNLFIQPLKIKKILSGLPTRQSNTMLLVNIIKWKKILSIESLHSVVLGG